jgi:hypothetical protein
MAITSCVRHVGMRLNPQLTGRALVAVASLLALLVTGCSDSAQEVRTVTVERQVATDDAPPPEKKHRKAREPAARTTPASQQFVNCDANIEAKADNTTCPFAQNVFWTYWTRGESSGPFHVWSPAAQASFATSCEGGAGQIVCTTSDSAVVRFPQAAVDAYSRSQADAYASGHDLGPDPYEDLPGTGPSLDDDGQGGGGEDCQGYDPCLPPGGDVDCAGGTGDGPRYVEGPVYVAGFDPYDLDRDQDGTGCDS